MSATIDTNKLKFSVFGRGYDDERGNSGSGVKDPTIYQGISPNTACIDETETYVWTTQSSGVHPIPYIRKRKLEDLSVVPQTVLPDTGTRLYHPCNVANNYGVAFQNYWGTGDIYVFDLTTDELYFHISGGFGIEPRETVECILVDNIIYFISPGRSRQAVIFKLDLENETWAWVSEVTVLQGTSCGFVDNDTFYMYSHAPWFSDYNQRFGYSINGVRQWLVTADIQGGTGFPNCKELGLCANGYIWLPTYTDGKWHLGKYNGNTGGDFNTPTPLKVIGSFNSSPEYSTDYMNVHYSDGKTNGCWYSPTYGLLATNFEDVFVVNSGAWIPLAMTENIIFARNRFSEQVGVFEY